MEENQMLEKDFKEVFKNIKNEILNAQYDIYKSANIRTLALYSYLGKIIDENAKYGNSFINNLSIELKINFPNIRGFSERNLLINFVNIEFNYSSWKIVNFNVFRLIQKGEKTSMKAETVAVVERERERELCFRK